MKVRFHPLFLPILVVSAFTGHLPVLLTATVGALEHELGHALVARRFGYTLDRVVLMPYGAVASGDLTGMSPKEEILITLAGPFMSAVTAFFFVALWWLFPETYPWTDTAVWACFSLFLVNLIPAGGLDGARLLEVITRPLGKRGARALRTVLSVLFGVGMVTVFVVRLLGGVVELTLLAFALFCVVPRGGKYVHVPYSHGNGLEKGIEERRIVFDGSVTVRRALGKFRADKYLVACVYEEGRFLGELTEGELLERATDGEWESKLSTIL